MGGGVVKVQKYTSVIQCCSGDIFFRAKNFFLTTIAESPLLCQSASGLNVYDRENLVSDIQAGDRNVPSLFLQCVTFRGQGLTS
jgi:hypothetical protein